MLILLRIVCLIIGYGFGLIQAGFLVGRIYNIDIRKEGSGNSGTTNAMRVLGVRAGLITFFIDAAKCVAAILLVRAFWGGNESFMLLAIYTGLGVTLGHNFPFYMNFKGGKGIAAMSGLVITMGVLTSPWFIIVPAFAFFSCAILTRFVSLGSLQVSVLFLFMTLFYGQMGGFDYLPDGHRIELYIVVLLLAVLAWYRHMDNIKRLLKGEENPFGSKTSDQDKAVEVRDVKGFEDWDEEDEEDEEEDAYGSTSRLSATSRFAAVSKLSSTYFRVSRRTSDEEDEGEEGESKPKFRIGNVKERLGSIKGRIRR